MARRSLFQCGFVYDRRTPEQRLISQLTNWQRKQWGRAGCPRDIDSLNRFCRLQRDGTELYVGEILQKETV